MSKNAFDELLESVTARDPNHGKALAEIAEAVPELKNGWLRQADYSRRMDDVKREKESYQDRLKYAEQWEAWRNEHWVDNAFSDGKGATKRELDAIKQAEEVRKQYEELQAKASLGGDMTFEEVGNYVNEMMQKAGMARKADLDTFGKRIDEEKAGVERILMGYSHIATTAPKLVYRHGQKFNGEELDVDQLVKFAAENGHADLNKAYSDYVAPRLRELEQKEVEAKIEAAKKEAREEALKERGMGPTQMPDDNRSPAMGHFQAKLMGVKPEGAESVPIPENAELGSGVIATLAARGMDRAS